VRVRIRNVIATSALIVLAVSGCTASQRRALGEEDVRVSLRKHVEQAAQDRHLALAGETKCISDLAIVPKVTASCDAATSSGARLRGTYLGTADIHAETCTATLTVTIDTDQVANTPDTKCFQ
jgi:hypothetical protein